MLRGVLLSVAVGIVILFGLGLRFDVINFSSARRSMLQPSIPLQSVTNPSFGIATTDFEEQARSSEVTKNIEIKYGKNSSTPTEHKQCIEHRDFLFNNDDIQKSVQAYSDFRRIL
jgi:hypothetical protein